MKKIVLTLLAIIAISSGAFAQVNDFRSKGYKGSLSIADQFGVWAGIETSHGYMFNSKNYIGAGVGVYMFPNGRNYPTFANFFVDYQHYFKDARNTPLAGVKSGLYKTLNSYESGWKFHQAVYLEPNVGYSWGLKNGKAFTTTLGASFYNPFGENYVSNPVVVMPKIGFTFEF